MFVPDMENVTDGDNVTEGESDAVELCDAVIDGLVDFDNDEDIEFEPLREIELDSDSEGVIVPVFEAEPVGVAVGVGPDNVSENDGVCDGVVVFGGV